MKVLLADDELDILRIYSEMLAGNGFDVTSASNGKDVLDQLDHSEFDMLILDLFMPEWV